MRQFAMIATFLTGTLTLSLLQGLYQGHFEFDELLYQASGWLTFVALPLSAAALISSGILWAISSSKFLSFAVATAWRKRATAAILLIAVASSIIWPFTFVFPLPLALSSLLAAIVGCRATVAA